MAAFNTGHEIVPRPGTARRVRDGRRADLRKPSDYPVTAACKVCGQPVRCERWLLAEWHHTGTGPGSG